MQPLSHLSSRYKIPKSDLNLEFLLIVEHVEMDPGIFRVLVINSIRESCRLGLANVPFPQTYVFSHRGTQIHLDHFNTMPGRPMYTWEDACVTLRGLLEYELHVGSYSDQVFRVIRGRYVLAAGRVSPPEPGPEEEDVDRDVQHERSINAPKMIPLPRSIEIETAPGGHVS